MVALHLRTKKEGFGQTLDLPRYQWGSDPFESGSGGTDGMIHGETFTEGLDILPKQDEGHEGSMKGFFMALMAKTFIYLFLMLFFVFASSLIIRPFLAERQIRTMPNSVIKQRKIETDTDQDALLKKTVRAIHWNSGNAEYYYRLAGIAMQCREIGDYSVIGQNRDLLSFLFYDCPLESDMRFCDKVIHKSLKKAIDLNPVNPFYHYTQGLQYVREAENLQRGKSDRWESLLDKADLAFERASHFFPNSPSLLYDIGNYWLWKSKVVRDNRSKRHRNRP